MRWMYRVGTKKVRMVTKKRGDRLKINVNAESTPQMLIVRRVKRVSSHVVVVGLLDEVRNGQGDGEDNSEMPIK